MRSISLYAKTHRLHAQVFITILHFALFACCVYVAILLDREQRVLPVTFMVAGLAGIAIAIGVYKLAKRRYLWQLVCFVTLSASIAVCQVYMYNNNRFVTYSIVTPALGVFEKKETTTQPNKKVSRAELRKQFKQLRSELKKAKAEGANGGVIVLIILGALIVFLLLASLSCSLACNGSEALAYVLLGLGLFGIILGTMALIKSANKRARNKKTTAPST